MEGCRVNYYFTGALIILLCSLAFCVTPAYPNTTQNNTSGSNTSITGGYTSSATNTYQSGSSNNTTTTNNSTSNMRSCLLYTSPSPRDVEEARMPSSA